MLSGDVDAGFASAYDSMHNQKVKGYRAAPAEVLYPKLPDPSVCIVTDKLSVLLGGSLLQLPGPLLLLLGV